MARILLTALALEVVVGRIAPALGADGSAVQWAGSFLHYFLAFLGLIVAFVAVWGLLRDGERFPRFGRVAVAITSAVFLSLVAVGLVSGMPGALRGLPHAAFAFALASLLLASLLGSAPHTARAGVFCIAVAPLLQSMSFCASVYAGLLPAAIFAVVGPGAEIGRAAAILLGIPALMVARPTRPSRWAMAAGAGVTIAAWIVFSWRPELAKAVFGLPIPPTRIGQVLALISVFMAGAALAAIWGRTVRRRAVGLGLGLVILVGLVPNTPAQLVVLFAAFLLLVRGVAASAPQPVGWRDYLSKVAQQVDAGDPVVIELRDEEVSRMRAERGPVDLRVVRCGDEIVQVDVATGHPPKAIPAWSATHRLASQPRRGRLPEGLGRALPSGAADFDQVMVVKGEGVSSWLDDEVRRLLLALPPGALAIWPGEGARWRAFPARTADPDRPVPLTHMTESKEPPIDDLVGVVRAVSEVARRASLATT